VPNPLDLFPNGAVGFIDLLDRWRAIIDDYFGIFSSSSLASSPHDEKKHSDKTSRHTIRLHLAHCSAAYVAGDDRDHSKPGG
jgi:hypothetical protein